MATLAVCARPIPGYCSRRPTAVDLSDETSERGAIEWWEDMSGAGGEGMVVKPLTFVHRGRRDLVTGREVPWPRVPASYMDPSTHANNISIDCASEGLTRNDHLLCASLRWELRS
jgi:hypothetical protein